MLRNDQGKSPKRLQELGEALAERGLRKVSFQHLTNADLRGKLPLFHSTIPNLLTIPDCILDGMSMPALVWLSSSALHKALQRLLVLLSAFLAFCFIILPAADTFPIIIGISVLVVGFSIYLFVVARIDMAMTEAADRAVTKNDSDRQAAQEALSFLYYLPLGWKAVLFPLHKVRSGCRARALGIELVRGFRADEPPGGSLLDGGKV